METCDFWKDLEFSENPAFWVDYDIFYESDFFREKFLSIMYRRKVPTVTKIIRSKDILMQKGAGIDALIALSNGTTLLIDEKTDRHIHAHSPNIFLEIMSNPSSEYQTEGWAYHRGRYFSYSCSNETESGLFYRPVFFFIDEGFINAFNRNSKYRTVPCKKLTNGLYCSIGKIIPRKDIEKFMFQKRTN